MLSTKQQRRGFIKEAKKRWKKGLISKEEYLAIKKDMNNLGKQQHESLRETILSEEVVEVTQDLPELDFEEDFEPSDL